MLNTSKSMAFLFLILSGAASGAPKKILFIGNSYTYLAGLNRSLPEVVGMMARNEGVDVQIGAVMAPMRSLKTQYDKGKALQKIRQGGWDLVVLQDNASAPISRPTETYRYVRLFDKEIKKIGAKTMLYLTWEIRMKPGTQKNLNHTYFTSGADVGAEVSPVGIAWGIYEKNQGDLVFRRDDKWSHASASGAYLAGLVFCQKIFNIAPALSPKKIFKKINLSVAQVNNLKEAARKAVSYQWPMSL